MKNYTREEVSSHKTTKDCWIIINDSIYDVTQFMNEHPGGKKVILRVGGKDATEQFNQLHQSNVLTKVAEKYKIGNLKLGM